MPRLSIAVLVALLAGIAVGAWIAGDDGDPAPASGSVEGAAPLSGGSDDERISRLEQQLAAEREARTVLEDLIQELIEDVGRLEGVRRVANPRQEAAASAPEPQTRSRTRDPADWMRNYQERRVNQLIEGGFSEDEARRTLKLESEARFEAMRRAWEAERNGDGIDPYDSLATPQTIMRQELGDDAYARYLEAQGQPTSIQISSVLEGSPGNTAGLQPGDALVSYNGRRVFDVLDLRRLTMEGNPGEDVVVEIERNGTRMQLTLPRGPIGITGSGASIRGMNWWGG